MSSAVCGKPSSSAEPWRGNRLAAVVDRNVEVHASEELSARFGPSQLATGVNRSTDLLKCVVGFLHLFSSKMFHGDVR